MGVDASLYSTKAKTRCYFDRLYNIEECFQLTEEERENSRDLLYRVMHHGIFFKEGLSKDEILKLINLNRKAWLKGPEDQRYHVYWLNKLERFINATGEDKYFVVTDHDIEWPDILDEYKEFEPD